MIFKIQILDSFVALFIELMGIFVLNTHINLIGFADIELEICRFGGLINAIPDAEE